MDKREPTLSDLHTGLEVLRETSKLQFAALTKQIDGISEKLDESIEAQAEEKAKNARVAGIVALVVTVLGFLLQSFLKHAG